MVAKVGGRGFAYVGLGRLGSVTLKFGESAVEWCERYPGTITVAAYLGRFGWNNVALDGGAPTGSAVPDDELRDLVDVSYQTIAGRLPRSARPAGWDVHG
jgi:predicted DNA-binding protein (MmcQ/YjbR family)